MILYFVLPPAVVITNVSIVYAVCRNRVYYYHADVQYRIIVTIIMRQLRYVKPLAARDMVHQYIDDDNSPC